MVTGVNNRPPIIGFDANLLNGWYQAQAANASLLAQRASVGSPVGTNSQTASAEATGARTEPAVVTPWDTSVITANPFDKKLREALASPRFIDTNSSFFQDNEISQTYEELFAAYQGLSKLATLAEYAADEETFSGSIAGLDRRFQSGLEEVLGFAASITSDDYALFTGTTNEKSLRSDSAIPRVDQTYTGQIAQNGPVTDPVAGLNGDEVFTLSIEKSGVTTDLQIDLSTLGADPPSLSNIAGLINAELDANGFLTRFNTVRMDPPASSTSSDGDEDTSGLPPDLFGLEINGSSIEKLTLSAANSQTSVFLTSATGTDEAAATQINKLGDLSATNPLRLATADLTPDEAERSLQTTSSALDSQGNLFVVGTTDSDLAGNVNQGAQDVFLRKYDNAGQVVWTKLLGSQDEASGFAVEVDAQDNVIVAGAAKGDLVPGSLGSGEDVFVAKFDATGREVFTRQIGNATDEAGLALATAADGSIFVSGRTTGTIESGLTNAGGQDAFLLKLDGAGGTSFARQFGTTGSDTATALDVDDAGNVFVASVENGEALVRKFSGDNGTDPALWTQSLGAVQSGDVSSLKVDAGNVYVGGATSNASFGGGPTVDSHSAKGRDGFLIQLQDNGASASLGYTTFLGDAKDDRVADIAIAGGEVFIAGQVASGIDGNSFRGESNGFAAKIAADGSREWLYQYGGQGDEAAAVALEADASGQSVLDILGLPRGTVNEGLSRNVVDRTTVRAGQTFELSVDGGRARTITVEADDSLRSLAREINRELLLDGRAEVRRGSDGERLQIEAFGDTRIEIRSGREGENALPGLGLGEAIILGPENQDPLSGDEPYIIGLGMDTNLSIANRSDAQYAVKMLTDAMGAIRDAYRDLTTPPPAETGPTADGPPPAFLQAQLANLQAGLARLQGGSPTTSLIL